MSESGNMNKNKEAENIDKHKEAEMSTTQQDHHENLPEYTQSHDSSDQTYQAKPVTSSKKDQQLPNPPVPPATGTGVPINAPNVPMYTQPVQHPAVITGQPVFIVSHRFPSHPTTIDCPYCHVHVTTQTHHKNGALVWLLCLLLFFFTFCLFWIPFLFKGLKDVVHTCPNCQNKVGRLDRL